MLTTHCGSCEDPWMPTDDEFELGSTDGPLDTHTTTMTIQRWCSKDVEAAQKLIVQYGGADLLPPKLKAVAREAGVERGGWPRMLVTGVGMRFFRRWLEDQLLPKKKDPDAAKLEKLAAEMKANREAKKGKVK